MILLQTPNDLLDIGTSYIKDNLRADNANTSIDIKYMHYLIGDNYRFEIYNYALNTY